MVQRVQTNPHRRAHAARKVERGIAAEIDIVPDSVGVRDAVEVERLPSPAGHERDVAVDGAVIAADRVVGVSFTLVPAHLAGYRLGGDGGDRRIIQRVGTAAAAVDGDGGCEGGARQRERLVSGATEKGDGGVRAQSPINRARRKPFDMVPQVRRARGRREPDVFRYQVDISRVIEDQGDSSIIGPVAGDGDRPLDVCQGATEIWRVAAERDLVAISGAHVEEDAGG